MFFVSENNLNNKILYPRIPQNYFTERGIEDNKIPRISFAPSIDKCLMALSKNIEGKIIYIHVPLNLERKRIYIPSIKQVPDSIITNEIWIMEKVKIKYIGKIKVLKSKSAHGFYYYYNNKRIYAELYDWKWKNII